MLVFRLLSLPYRQFLQFSSWTNIPPIMVVFVYISVFVFISFAIKIYPSSVHFWIRKIAMSMTARVKWIKMLNERIISFSSYSKTVHTFFVKFAKHRSIEPRSGHFSNIPNSSIIRSQIKQNRLTVKAIFIIFYHFFCFFRIFNHFFLGFFHF